MIDIYFIRHGQTDGNVAKRHQAEHTKLTAKGKEQAHKVGQWAQGIGITHFYSSRHVRTLQTSQIIGEAVEMTAETRESLIELKRPTAIYGNRHRSLRSVVYLFLWYLGFSGSEGDTEKGESYASFRARLGRAQTELEQLPDDSKVIVVSHAVFIGFMARHLCDKRRASLFGAFTIFFKMLKLHNGGYTHVRFNPNASDGVCAWQLVSYDNHEHQAA